MRRISQSAVSERVCGEKIAELVVGGGHRNRGQPQQTEPHDYGGKHNGNDHCALFCGKAYAQPFDGAEPPISESWHEPREGEEYRQNEPVKMRQRCTSFRKLPLVEKLWRV